MGQLMVLWLIVHSTDITICFLGIIIIYVCLLFMHGCVGKCVGSCLATKV